MSTSAPTDECRLHKCQLAKRNNVAHVARYDKLVESAAAEKKEADEKLALEVCRHQERVKLDQDRTKRLEISHDAVVKNLESKLKVLKDKYLPEKRTADKCRKEHALVNPGGETLVADLASANRRGDRLEREKTAMVQERDTEAARVADAEKQFNALKGEKETLEKASNGEIKSLKEEIDRVKAELGLAHNDLYTANDAIRSLRDDLHDFKCTKNNLVESEDLLGLKKEKVIRLKCKLENEENQNDDDKREMNEAHKATVKVLEDKISDMENNISDLNVELDGEKAFAEQATEEAKKEIHALKEEIAAWEDVSEFSNGSFEDSDCSSLSIADQSSVEVTASDTQVGALAINSDERKPAVNSPSTPSISTIQIIQIYEEKPTITATIAEAYQEECRQNTGLQATIVTLEDKITNLESTNSCLEDKVTELESDTTTLESKVTALKADAITFNTTNGNLQAEIDTLKADNSTLQSKVTEVQASNDTLDEKVTALQAEAKTLKTDKDSLKTHIETLQSERTKQELKIAEIESSNTALGNKVSDLENDVDFLKSTNTDLKNKLDSLKTQKTTLDSKVTVIEAENTSLGNKVTSLTTEVDALKSTNDDLKTKLKTSKGENLALLGNVALHETEAVNLNTKNTNLGDKVDTLKTRITTLEDKITSLQTNIDSLEGKNKVFSGSIKHYQKENNIRQARMKEYAYGIYTGQTSPKLVFGKDEYPSACLNNIGKKAYLQLRVQGHRNEKVQDLMAAAVPEASGPKRGGRRKNNKKTKENNISSIKEEVNIPIDNKMKAPVSKLQFDESDHEGHPTESQSLPALSKSYKSTFRSAFEKETLEAGVKTPEEIVKQAHERWMSSKAEIMKLMPWHTNQHPTSTVQNTATPSLVISNIMITPASTNSPTNITVSSSVAPGPAPTSVPAPTTPMTPDTPSTWSFSLILGYMIGW
ncbi:hypothetical protein ONS95_007418 [Cadophora gregata]|uniref:uncharacterized protein n=1 Tax=Cadophora gregata TaxID=51156 RepID=UPI0026DA7D83|nr:uncharacterized protein ONS95_007418 [Cadophora gregata]KAK0118528.1 hypothetical protein ONS96_011624 [Cadophora gregata f. sp. sojae]KAK0125786.1 hypothetical protein ONS95_007418 [Cadophora gregata]